MEDWAEGFGAAITIVDRDLVVVYMNGRSAQTFAKWGGRALLGKSLANCHTEGSMAAMRRILETGEPHSYTVEKGGARKVVHQAPWERGGERAGLVEIAFEVPPEMEHRVRD
jgi:transcriptional regulator with PAS, ATPase and Fis domain